MRPYFTRERFGRPQLLSALLLLAFLGQAIWLVHAELSGSDGIDGAESVRLAEGWKQWHGRGLAGAPFMDAAANMTRDWSHSDEIAFDRVHSPLLYLASAAPLLAWPRSYGPDSAQYWRWLPRLPFLACGLFLGASLWYVARRLCGNHGGFIALTLYCFSPAMIQTSAVWHTEPEIVTVWGAFGTIFTAIAVAHTLYAPREVVLWNWRRIVLLGVSLAIAVGAQFSMIVLLPLALGFLLYVAPVRRRAGLVIWVAGCIIAGMLLAATYFFHLHALNESLHHADFWSASWRNFVIPGVFAQVAVQIGRACPAFALLLPVTLLTYLVWPRTRYFGNTAPLLVALLFLVLALAEPHAGGQGFALAAAPFLLVFVSGVLADLLETKYRVLLSACILAFMAAYVLHTLLRLAEVPRG
ncbi:MAG TPA: hypothetical protein VMH04_17615 [Candidatus Solibacter sp.]|nr:hypothetical protein [Candidatus Solibacter sp.]